MWYALEVRLALVDVLCYGIEASTMFTDNLDVHGTGGAAGMGWCALWDGMGVKVWMGIKDLAWKTKGELVKVDVWPRWCLHSFNYLQALSQQQEFQPYTSQHH